MLTLPLLAFACLYTYPLPTYAVILLRRALVVSYALTHQLLLQGGILLALCFTLSLLDIVKSLQNRALLSQAFDRGVTYAEISRLLSSQS